MMQTNGRRKTYPIDPDLLDVLSRLSPEAQRALATFLAILEREWRS